VHTVKRGLKPDSLNINSTKWTNELLQQVPLYNKFSDIPSKYVNKYKQADVKDTLKEMYKGLCCYCESPIGIQTYEQIEHLRPKSIFHDKCFQWENLHLSCEVCNISYKKDKWDNVNTILDPTKDNIGKYLKIDLDTGEILPINNNPRAITTINHVGLNREDLLKRRRNILVILKKSLIMYNKSNQVEEFKTNLVLLSKEMGYKLLFDTFIGIL